MSIDVTHIRKQVVNTLTVHGYKPGDADGADFRNPERPHVRFKVGTVYGEVSVTCWDEKNRQFRAIRILNDGPSLERGLREVEELVYPVVQVTNSRSLPSITHEPDRFPH